MKIISVSNRHLCGDFFGRLKELSLLGIQIILREKDLDEQEYLAAAKKALAVSGNIILHSYVNAAKELGCKKIHLPMHLLETADISSFDVVGVSVHSAEEASRAERLGASYITAGHIFATDCKKGIPPRGIGFLSGVCKAVDIPVYAIGGITPGNAADVLNAGAAGICVMSSLMQTDDPASLLNEFYRRCGRDI